MNDKPAQLSWLTLLTVAVGVTLWPWNTRDLGAGQVTPAAKTAVAEKPATVDLGGGQRMQFVWVEALKMWVGKYEVTNGEYRRCKPEHISSDFRGRPLTRDFVNHFFPPGEENNKDDPSRTFDGDRQPVVCVDFNDAKAYAAWINKKHGDAMPAGYRARLPSETVWMTYVQCGDGRKYPWGDELYPYGGEKKRLPTFGNYQGQECAKRPAPIGDNTKVTGYDDGFPITCPVEKSGRNEWGLYGVGGNAWEACTSDFYGPTAFGAWRGSSWYGWHGRVENNLMCSWRVNNDGTIKSAIRSGAVPYLLRTNPPKTIDDITFAATNFGFRLVLSNQEADKKAERARLAAQPGKPAMGTNTTPPGKPLTLNLGAGVEMEFVWIEALKMWVGKYELTNSEYKRLYPKHRTEIPHLDREPAVWLNFDDIKEYATWLNWKHTSQLPAGYRVRLPRETEWMAFAQCGDGRLYPWGNKMPPKYGNYSGEEVGGGVPGGGARGQSMVGYNDGYVRACPVEKSGKNDWGLYGVGGNVAEACAKDSANTSFAAWYGTSFYPHGPAHIDLQCYKGRVPNNGMNRVWMCGARLVLSQEPPPPPLKIPTPGKTMKVDLGGSVVMELVWVEPLKMWVGKYEVTNGEMRRFVPKLDSGGGLRARFIDLIKQGEKVDIDQDRQPVAVGASWVYAKKFCEWLTEKARKEGQIANGLAFRLPYDWEWSVAAGLDEPLTGTPMEKDGKILGEYPWGRQWPPPPKAGNFHGQEDKTPAGKQRITGELIVDYNDGFWLSAPVGSFAPNQYGLYDMGGNATEYREDFYNGVSGDRTLRGLGWYIGAHPCSLLTCKRRNTYSPDGRGFETGFRVVCVDAARGSAPPWGKKVAARSVQKKPSAPWPANAKGPPSGKPLTLDLGGRLGLEFVWVEPLKMLVGKYEV